MSRTLTLNINVTDEEFASLIARFADRAVLNADGGNIAVPSVDEDDDDTTVSDAATGLDSAGVPWIEGVHSSSKKQNADGTWRLMKGVDKTKAAAAIEAAKAPASTAPIPQASTVPAILPTSATATVELPVAAPAVAPVGLPGMPALAPVPAPVVDVPVSYQDVINKATELSQKGVANETFAGIYAAAGVTDTNALLNDETLRRALMVELNKVG